MKLIAAVILAAMLSGCIDPVGGGFGKLEPWPWEVARWEREAKAEAEARDKAHDAAHPDYPVCPKCGHRMRWCQGTEANPTAWCCCGSKVEQNPYDEAARKATEATDRKLAPEMERLIPSKEELEELMP